MKHFFKRALAVMTSVIVSLSAVLLVPDGIIVTALDTQGIDGVVKQIETSLNMSGALTEDGKLYIWGKTKNFFGSYKYEYTPKLVAENVDQFALGGDDVGYVTKQGNYYACGYNFYGELGDGTTNKYISEPKLIRTNVKKIYYDDAGWKGALIDTDGTLFMYGENVYGSLGNNTKSGSVTLTPEPVLKNVRDAVLDNYCTAAITEDNRLYTWGNNFAGQLGNGTEKDQYAPVEVNKNVDRVAITGYTINIIANDKKLYVTGVYNQDTDYYYTTSTPRLIDTNVTYALYNGDQRTGFSAIVYDNGDLYCKGINNDGEVGNGNTESQSKLTYIMGNVKEIKEYGGHCIALKEDGSVYTWGTSSSGASSGALGIGTNKTSYVPVKVGNFGGKTGGSTMVGVSACELESAILNEKNLVNTYEKYYLSETIGNITDPSFNIFCSVTADSSEPIKYQLYKGMELISTSFDGNFTLKEKDFLDKQGTLIEGDVFVNVISKEGLNRKTKLKLDIAQSDGITDNIELSLLGKDTSKATIPSNVPFFGGSNISISGLTVPVYAILKEDGTVIVWVNLINKDILDKDSSWNNFKNCVEKNKKHLGPEDSKLINNSFKQNNLKELKKYLKATDCKDFKLFDPKSKLNMTVVGYGEAKMDASKDFSIDVSITVGAEYNGSISWQTFVVSVPIVIEGEFKGGGSVTADFKWTYDIAKKSWDYEGEMPLDFEIGVDVFAGVGVRKVASVGVTGGGKLSGSMTLVSSKKTGGLDTLDGTLYAGIKVKVLCFTYSQNIAEKTWNLYARDPESISKASDGNDVLNLYKQDNYILSDICSEELVDRSVTGNNAENSVVTGLECSAAPKIISVNNGILMTYLSNDSNRGTANSTVLKYMFYNNDTQSWSASEQVDTDKTADWYSELYNFNGKIYLIYSQADRIFDDDVTITDMMSSMKISAAEYDEESNRFINLTDISSTDKNYNSMPEFAVIDNKLTAFWVSSSADDIFNQNTDNTVKYSTYSGGEWSSPLIVASGLPTITSLSAGKLADGAFIAVSADKDSDLSTDGDSQIIIIDMEGNENVVYKGNVENVQYSRIPSAGKNGFTWYNGKNISYMLSSATTGVLTATENDSKTAVTSDYLILSDKIFFVYTDNEGKSSVFQLVFENGKWSSPLQVESADGFISSFTVNDDVIIYSDTSFASSDTVTEATTIDMYRYDSKYDIEVSAIDFDYTQITPGKQMNIELYLTNYTDKVLENAAVRITNSSGETVSSVSVDCNIAPGEYDSISIPFTVPETVDNSKFTVCAEGAETDTNPENNSIDFSLGKTELSLSVSERLIDSKCYYFAEIKNESCISTGGTFTITDSSGEAVYSEKINTIPANKTTEHIVDLSKLSKICYSDILVCTVTSDTEEYYINNNTVSEFAEKLDDSLPYVAVAFIDENSNDIVRKIYKTGSDITPPAFPNGTDIWVIFGDETNTPVTSFKNITDDKVYVAKKDVLPKAVVEEPSATPIRKGQTLNESILTSGWIWTDGTTRLEAAGEYAYDAYMVVTDYEKYDYSDIPGYDESTHRITRSVTIKSVGIINIRINQYNVSVYYGIDSETELMADTIEFNEVSTDMIEWMYLNDSSCGLLSDFVNAFEAYSQSDSILLTDAQMKALEYVLSSDYGNTAA